MPHLLRILFVGMVLLVGVHARAMPPLAANVTITYDVRDLLAGTGSKKGHDRIEKIVALIFKTTGPRNWSSTRKGAATLDVVNNAQLEVRGSAELHRQIANLLAPLRRREALGVQVRAELREVDRTFYEKQIRPRLEAQRPAATTLLATPVEEQVAVELHKHSKLVKSRRTHIAGEGPVTLLSLRRAFTYATLPSVFAPGADGFGTGSTGVMLEANVRVSADRRFVWMKIGQTTSELIKMVRRTYELDTGELIEVEHPRFREQATSTTVRVGDGNVLLVPIHARLDRTRGKDKVWVVVLRPSISLADEDRERGKDKR